MLILGFAGVALLMLLLAQRHWDGLNSRDMGTMSQQWLAEYNAQHP
jgi:hypothetical protein